MASDQEHSDGESHNGPPKDLQQRRRRKPRIAPCTNCRERHLKCDEALVCRRCQRDGEPCIRRKGRVKFKTGSSAKYDAAFSKDQTWTKPASDQPLQYVHESGGRSERAEEVVNDQPVEQGTGANPATSLETHATDPEETLWVANSKSTNAAATSHVNTEWTENLDQAGPATSPYLTREWTANSNTSPEISLAQQPLLQEQPRGSPDQSLLRAVLLRYFIDHLARWFDLCDPEKHFELVVPQRARQCPPLMNSILTASARHLTRAPEDLQIFMAPRLPELNSDTAVYFHNLAIQDLIELAADPDQARNENLLAAATILRFYEEIDAPLREEETDGELFLRVTSVFITEQFPLTPHVPHSSPLINYSSTVAHPESGLYLVNSSDGASRPSLPENLRPPRPEGLRQAGFWVAFRQEIYTSFLKQRAFTIPLSHCDGFRSWAPAEDAVWADRMIVFCADVIDFCYGSTDSATGGSGFSPNLATSPPASAADRWRQLKQTEQLWDINCPASFAPLYSHEADRSRNEVFPEIWYLLDCHVTGLQHLELARILLAVHDPTQPKLGPGHFSSLKKLSQTLQGIVLKLCGMALGNRKVPPALVTAYLGISTCGDHFQDRLEQEAILSLLETMQLEYRWPAGSTVEGLKDAWGWNEDG